MKFHESFKKKWEGGGQRWNFVSLGWWYHSLELSSLRFDFVDWTSWTAYFFPLLSYLYQVKKSLRRICEQNLPTYLCTWQTGIIRTTPAIGPTGALFRQSFKDHLSSVINYNYHTAVISINYNYHTLINLHSQEARWSVLLERSTLSNRSIR